jgi:hypothetical protein
MSERIADQSIIEHPTDRRFEDLNVEVSCEGRDTTKNEDFYGVNEKMIVVADGATDKSGQKYDGKTGGELASRVVVATCLETDLVGEDLVLEINQRIGKLYETYGIAERAVEQPEYRFGASFVACRIQDDVFVITFVGDVGFRINGTDVYQGTMRIDEDNARRRADYINAYGVDGCAEYMQPFFLGQFVYQNIDNEDPYSYGSIDGVRTPTRFVGVRRIPLADLKTVELFTDGYIVPAPEPTIESWKATQVMVDQVDPLKINQYLEVKANDDKTILIKRF